MSFNQVQNAIAGATQKLAANIGSVSPSGEFLPGALHDGLDEAFRAFQERALDQLARMDQHLEELSDTAASEQRVKQGECSSSPV